MPKIVDFSLKLRRNARLFNFLETELEKHDYELRVLSILDYGYLSDYADLICLKSVKIIGKLSIHGRAVGRLRFNEILVFDAKAFDTLLYLASLYEEGVGVPNEVSVVRCF